MLSEQFEQFLVEVSVSIIEAPLTFFEMQIKSMRRHTIELLQSSFGKARKALDAIDVAAAKGKLIGSMLDPKMLGIANVHQAVVTAPTVAVNDSLRRHAPAYNGLQRGFFAVRHDFGVDLAASFQEAKHRCFARRAPTSLTSHATSAKVGFVHFNFAACERRFLLAGLSQAHADFKVNAVHGLVVVRPVKSAVSVAHKSRAK